MSARGTYPDGRRDPAHVTWQPTAKLRAFVAVISAGLLVGLVAGRPEPVLLVAPLGVAVAMGLAGLTSQPIVCIRTGLDRTLVTEGDTVTMVVGLEAPNTVPELDLLVGIPPGLSLPPGQRARTVSLAAGAPRQATFSVTADRWGSYDLGEGWVRARSRLGMLDAEGYHPNQQRLIVYPRPETLRRLVRARRTQLAAGNQLALTKGLGVEFADLRPFVPGDRVREINWRVTARRGAPWVNERHPDRSTDVVVFLDAFGGPTLPTAVRVATSLASAYLAQRDRVGLVGFGGTVRWLRPGSGLRQQYRVVDTLLATRPFPSVAWKAISLLPPRVLPPSALVVAVSPLADERALRALLDLRDRGIDLVVIEVSRVPFVRAAEGAVGELAHRLWRLQQAVLRDEYRSLGVPVVEWSEGQPLTEAVEAARAWPRGRRQWTG